MFNALPKPSNMSGSRMDKDTLAAFSTQIQLTQIGISLAKTKSALLSTVARLHQTSSDFSDLRLLRRTIKTQGLNRPLLAFVNPKGRGISRFVSGVPSTEDMDSVAVGPEDKRTMDTISGIDDALDTQPEVVADHIRAGADSVDKILDITKNQVQDYGYAVSHHLLNLMDCGEEPEKYAGLANTVVEAVPHDCTSACIEGLLDVLPVVDAVVSEPTDKDAMDAHKAKMDHIVDKVGSHAGLDTDSSNPHQVMLCDKSPEMTPVVDTMAAHGYTIENLTDLLKKSDALIDELNGLIDRKEAVVGNLMGAATMVVSVDNDVPPAVDDAIPMDEDAPDMPAEESGYTTQADMIQCHATSHMCCIAALTDAAVCAVQNVLSVAEHVGNYIEDCGS